MGVHTYFPESADTLSGMVTILEQAGRTVTLDHGNCNAAYFAQLTAAMRSGMSLRITYWGSDPKSMSWMDQPPCGEQTCTGSNAGDATISDITVTPVQGNRPMPTTPGRSTPTWLTWMLSLLGLAMIIGLAFFGWQFWKSTEHAQSLRRMCNGERESCIPKEPPAERVEAATQTSFSALACCFSSYKGSKDQSLVPAQPLVMSASGLPSAPLNTLY